jgi:hypothetical protein
LGYGSPPKWALEEWDNRLKFVPALDIHSMIFLALIDIHSDVEIGVEK